MADVVAESLDPYWEYVTTLMNMEGADGSNDFPDSASSRVWTPAGSVQVDTSLGYNAALFDGDGDFLSASYYYPAFTWWTNDYALEAWINVADLSTWSYVSGVTEVPVMIGNADPFNATDYWSFGPISTGQLRLFYYNGSGQTATSTDVVEEGVLTHVALIKTVDGIRFAINGVLGPNIAIAGTPLDSSIEDMVIGQMGNRSISGHIRALRITKGQARYTSNFTPPSAPFPTS
ncbi:MAG: LamG-like jellyroll fold domain-containing protein [Lysobacter sp.]